VAYALLADGTIWARRAGQWVFVTEVPNTTILAQAQEHVRGAFARATVGAGLLRGSFEGSLRLEDRELLVDSLAANDFRGVALGPHIAWLLASDGRVYEVDCRATTPCASAPVAELGDRVAGIVQLPRGGAFVVGANGLAAMRGPQGNWRRLTLPAEAARHSLVAVAIGPDSAVAMLGQRHVLAATTAGEVRVIGTLPPRLRRANLVASLPGGTVAVCTPEATLAYFDQDGSFSLVERPLGTAGQAWAVLPLKDGRLIVAMGEAEDDPFAQGSVMVVSPDPGHPVATLPIKDPRRTSFRSLEIRSLPGSGREVLTAYGVGSVQMSWPISTLPFAHRIRQE
jgi:hypothetical protein